MKNFVNFDPTTQKFQKLSFMTLNSDAKFE